MSKNASDLNSVDKWYKPRSYTHFDLQVSKDYAKSQIENPDNIIKHSFWPFLKRIQQTPSYKPDLNKTNKKDRPIMYASHIDSHIYSWYTHLLNEQYEDRIKNTALNSSVLAYRTLGKSNIDFAKDVFDEIERKESATVLTFDISKFFDCIDHEKLKLLWCQLLDLNSSKLPEDHYKVYKSITKYSYINMSDVCQKLDIKDHQNLKYRKRICSPQEFRSNLKSIIKTNKDSCGIPQGSPISALLSNIFLWEFDVSMSDLASEVDGIYRRYCDDIIWICPQEQAKRINQEVKQGIQGCGSRMRVNEEKSQEFEFIRQSGILCCHPKSKPLQYLGFTFDGQKRLIRSQTISRYYRRMKRAIYFTRKAAQKSNQGKIIYRRGLYERFTHLGKRNFIKYAYRASEIMNSTEIRSQTKRHWKKINAEIS
jgi:RNA-directed DNA polymerase